MKHHSRPTVLAVAIAQLLLVSGNAAAQDYRFRVQQMGLQVDVQPDASARLHYKIDFANQPGAHAIDIVDIGLPHRNYSIQSMSASIDGEPLSDIRKSEYIDVGVEVRLQQKAIPPGQSGTFEFQCTMPDMVYRDTTDSSRASLQIKPTWFDTDLQVGKTQLQVAVHLLAQVEPNEVTYHSEKNRYDELVLYGEGQQKHVVAIWQRPAFRLSRENPKFSVSFPQRGMQRVVRTTAIGLFLKWFRESQNAQMVSGTFLLGALALLFFRFSHGTGCAVFVVLVVGLVWLMVQSPGLHLLSWPVMLGLVGVNEWYLRRIRRTSYLPALATVEGGGIKRGLTAPLAAVLLELPLGKVLTLVVFGMLKKGAVRLVSQSPLVVTVDEEFRCPRKMRLKRAAARGIALHEYEHPFLDRLQAWDGPVDECDLNEALGKLIRSAAGRMKGFDKAETVAYYRRIIASAWKEAESVGELQHRSEVVDRNIDWMIMEPRWIDLFEIWGRRGYHYRPTWTQGPSSSPAGGAAPPAPTSTSQTGLGEVAASFAGWTENTAARFAGAVEPVSLGIDLPGGVVDLSGVDKVTGDVFEALASSGGGGGGSGGCACACAGCACACACAGGGR